MNNTAGSIINSAHSCRYCREVVIKRPSQQQCNETIIGNFLPIAEIDGLTAMLAASDGCNFFEWAVKEFNKHEDRSKIDDGDVYDDWSLEIGMLKGHLDEDESNFPFVSFKWHHKNGEDLYIEWLAIIAEKDDSAARYITTRPTSRAIASEEVFSLALGWLNDCEANHDRCNTVARRTMPSRVIEIGWMRGSQEPSLRLLQNPPWENYVALSYCWGGDQPIKTTLSTIQQFSSALPFSELPKSLRDAVLTTFSLSLRLLWVDSLCIIQDNSVETAKEIASMPQVYQNAHVTISAARSACCQDGFLHEISMPSAQSEVFKLPFCCPDGNVGSVNLLHEPDFWDPIERRAWPLQEFLLSRRILKYGSYQLSWSCLCVGLHENEDAKVKWFRQRDQRFLTLRWRYHDSRYNTSDSWRHLVQEYTSRKLMESKDRLLAISGLATDIGTRRDDTYLGGLWLRDLPVGLLWQVTSDRQPRPREYRAPSWSWASVDGPVGFFVDAEVVEVDPDMRVLSNEVKPAEPTAPYGALESGYIEILGRMRRANWIIDRKTLVDIETGDATDGEAWAYTSEDAYDGLSIGPISVWCLQICPYDPILEKGPFGLILTTEDERLFRRVGIFSFDPDIYEDEEPSFYDFHREKQQKWADGCQLRTIIII